MEYNAKEKVLEELKNLIKDIENDTIGDDYVFEHHRNNITSNPHSTTISEEFVLKRTLYLEEGKMKITAKLEK